MRFFGDHFTSRLLLSPIHAAEVYYKRKYHLNFVHAKKLFVLDMILLATILVLIGATIFWFSYKPGTADLVSLGIATPGGRLLSGGELTYTIFYQNNNPFTLKAPRLKVSLPESFVVDSVKPNETEASAAELFTLPDLHPKDNGSVAITGRLYQTPQQETAVVARLSYQGAASQIREEVITRALNITRDSVLTAALEAPEKILNRSTISVTIKMRNQGDIAVKNVAVPLPALDGVAWGEGAGEGGRLENNIWQINQIEAGAALALQVPLALAVSRSQEDLTVAIAPGITVNNKYYPQMTIAHRFVILHPAASISARWEGATKLQPGGSKQLNIEIANRGSVDLSDLTVSIPISTDVIDTARLAQITVPSSGGAGWTYSSSALTTDKTQLRRGETMTFKLTIPIRPAPRGGTDLTLTLSPRLTASVKEVPDGLYTTTASSLPLALGTDLDLSANLAYYTTEGDQLGRGPLPPQVGKETKYWAIIEIRNTTSRVENLILSARLAPGATWTGRTSVSQGESPQFNSAARTVSWQIPALNPHERVAVNFELAFTPAPEHRGETPVAIENLTLTGEDTYINETLRKKLGRLDVSLPADAFARKRGVVVE